MTRICEYGHTCACTFIWDSQRERERESDREYSKALKLISLSLTDNSLDLIRQVSSWWWLKIVDDYQPENSCDIQWVLTAYYDVIYF